MNKQAVSTFKLGLVMDLNPLANDNKSLTNALNATFITQNGNELMLLNDMGNGRINRVRLDDGYIPVGIKEYGGIIYIASYNPKNGKGQIGSFPYPKLEWEGSDFEYKRITLDSLYGDEYIEAKPLNDQDCILSFYEIKDDSIKIPLLVDSSGEQLKIHSGDSFSISFNNESTLRFLNSPNVNIKVVVKTSSNYYLVSDNKEDITNGTTFVYGGSYSGYVYLLIDLVIYNNFEVDYILNEAGATIYPRAFNDTLGEYYGAVILKDKEEKLNEDKNNANVTCDFLNFKNSLEVLTGGIYHIYPITLDGGYIKNLHRKINIPEYLDCDNNVSQFKYIVENNTIKLLLEYQTKNDEYLLFGGISYKYRFYPIRSIKDSINNQYDLLNLYKTNNYTLEVSKSGYTTKSGIRYLEAELPENDIYLLIVSCKKQEEDEEVLLTRFIYGTSRYNDLYESLDDFNLIPKEDKYIEYSLDSNIFLAELLNIDHYHLINDEWIWVLDLIKYSEEPFTNIDLLPKSFRSEISVLLKKTTDPFIECTPEENYKYIFDKDSFLISTDDVSISILSYNDNPLKSSNDVLETGLPGNNVRLPSVQLQSMTFYRYISSKSDDGIVLLDRTLKTIAPVFDPNNLDGELVAWEYDNTSISSVICAKKFLTTSCNRLLNPHTPEELLIVGSNYSYLLNEESLSSGSVRLTNLQAALLNHSEESTGNSSPSIFDTYSGGSSTDGTEAGDYRDAADQASLRIQRNMNSNENAGIVHNNNSGHDEIHDKDNWMIATCLNIKGKPMPINLAGMCYNKVFDGGTFVGDYVDNSGNIQLRKNSDQSKYPTISSEGMKDFTYINAAKKLLFLLSLVFTLLNLLKNIYLIGPSINTINYNIQDNSYINYSCNVNYNFTSEIDITLNKLEASLNSLGYCNNILAKNYIGSLKSAVLNNTYNYGHLINLGNQLFGNVLSLYEEAYDNEEIIDESKGYSDEEIYYLDPNKLSNIIRSINSYSHSDSDNYIWPSLGIKFDTEHHCFTYELNKLDTLKYISKSDSFNDYEYLFDWTGCKWRLKPLASSFITVFKALRNYSNVLSGLNHNFIVLNKTSTSIPAKWTEGKPDSRAPGVVFIDFGLRGLCKGSRTEDRNQLLPVGYLRDRLSQIINNYEHQELINNGYYNE